MNLTGASGTPTAVAREQRRVLVVLVVAQVLSGAGLAAGITVGALLAQRMLGSTGLSGLPAALFTLGSALAALFIGRVSQARGRRAGLAWGYAAGAVGAVGVVGAVVLDQVVLLFVALFVYGAGFATNLQARYAGADLAAPSHRGRAVSTVLVATTLGGVLGPNLATATDSVATGFGLPSLTGPFALAALAYGAAAVVLALLLRPDPLLRARALQVADHPEGSDRQQAVAGDRGPDVPVGRSPAVLAAATVMIATQLVMVGIMTMTPVHVTEHGHGVGAAGLIIGLHVAAMYLPAPVSGWLVDRVGTIVTALLAALVLTASGLLAALAPEDSLPLLTVALVLLGLGWSLGLISGTAALSHALPPATRARTQGSVDVAVALGGAAGGLGSGFVVAAGSYAVLGLLGAAVAAVALPAAALLSRRTTTARPADPGR